MNNKTNCETKGFSNATLLSNPKVFIGGNEITDYNSFMKVAEENERLKDNWNQLKRWLEIELECKCKLEYVLPFRTVLIKMQELELL